MPPKIPRPKACRLQNWKPKTWDRYRNWCETQTISHRILPQLHAIYDTMNKIQQEIGETLNKVDPQCKEIGLEIENHCRRLQTGIVDISPEISKL